MRLLGTSLYACAELRTAHAQTRSALPEAAGATLALASRQRGGGGPRPSRTLADSVECRAIEALRGQELGSEFFGACQ